MRRLEMILSRLAWFVPTMAGLVIIVFLKIVSTFSYKPFVYYRLGLAALVVILLLTGVLDANSAPVTT